MCRVAGPPWPSWFWLPLPCTTWPSPPPGSVVWIQRLKVIKLKTQDPLLCLSPNSQPAAVCLFLCHRHRGLATFLWRSCEGNYKRNHRCFILLAGGRAVALLRGSRQDAKEDIKHQQNSTIVFSHFPFLSTLVFPVIHPNPNPNPWYIIVILMCSLLSCPDPLSRLVDAACFLGSYPLFYKSDLGHSFIHFQAICWKNGAFQGVLLVVKVWLLEGSKESFSCPFAI